MSLQKHIHFSFMYSCLNKKKILYEALAVWLQYWHCITDALVHAGQDAALTFKLSDRKCLLLYFSAMQMSEHICGSATIAYNQG